MRVYMVNTDGVREVDVAEDLADKRTKVREWCNMEGVETRTNWVAVLDVLADTVDMVGKDFSDDEAPLKAIEALTRDDIGTCLGLAAYGAALVGWNAPQMVKNYAALGAAVAGWAVGAILVGANKSDVSVEVIWRVVDSLTAEERETVTAQIGAVLHTLGFTGHEVRGLRDAPSGE